MEDTNKQEIIEQLCALRAGLSVISVEADKAREAEAEAMNKIRRSGEEKKRQLTKNKDILLSHLGYEVTYKRGSMRLLGGGFSEEEYKKCYQLREIEESYRSHKAVADEHANSMQKRKKKYTIFWIISAICLVLAVVSFICIRVSDVFFGLLGGFCIQATIAFFIVAAKKTSSTNRDKKSKYKEISELNERILSERFAIDAYPQWVNEAKLTVSQMEQKLIPILDKCNALYDVLYDKYSLLLNERDWQYSDLIIFYFETGRADTMKEALQLVEREAQTQRIEGAIGMASRQICGTIKRVAEVISLQLNLITVQVSEVILLQYEQTNQTSRLVSRVDMNNALVAKANATSQQLMKDVEKMKSYIKK